VRIRWLPRPARDTLANALQDVEMLELVPDPECAGVHVLSGKNLRAVRPDRGPIRHVPKHASAYADHDLAADAQALKDGRGRTDQAVLSDLGHSADECCRRDGDIVANLGVMADDGFGVNDHERPDIGIDTDDHAMSN